MIRLIYQGRLVLEERKRESPTEQSKEERNVKKYSLGGDGDLICIYMHRFGAFSGPPGHYD